MVLRLSEVKMTPWGGQGKGTAALDLAAVRDVDVGQLAFQCHQRTVLIDMPL